MGKKRFLLLFLGCIACSSLAPKKNISIGIDPTFTMSEVGNKQAQVLAFTNELLEELFKNTPFSIQYVQLSYDNMTDTINACEVDFIVSSLSKTVENIDTFNFSERFLSLGEVFVTRVGASSTDYRNFTGKLIAIENNPPLLSLFSNYPMILLTYYNSIPKVLEDIVLMNIDGAMIPSISLSSHFSPDYKRLLKIDPQELTSQGLYLIALNNQCNAVKEIFNKRLGEFIKKGLYQKLLEKWDLVL